MFFWVFLIYIFFLSIFLIQKEPKGMCQVVNRLQFLLMDKQCSHLYLRMVTKCIWLYCTPYDNYEGKKLHSKKDYVRKLAICKLIIYIHFKA
jgi:hypothetical protein